MTVMLATAQYYIGTFTGILLTIFNLGIAARILKDLLSYMGGEEINIKKKMSMLIKALIVINCIGALIPIIKNYVT